MAHEVFTYWDIQITETQLLIDVADAISDATERLRKLSEDVDQVELRKAVEKAAHVEAINFITDRAEQFLTDAFMQAIFNTVEYNHALFIGRSQEAIQMHWREVLSVIPLSPGKVRVDVDFNPLGDIETYAAAVEAAREALGFKMTSAPESRSIYWARNIYGVSREGAKIGKTLDRGPGKTQTIDITSSYLGKWETTIKTRLGFLESGQAPWWYILNHGNVDAFSESSGTPYPVIQGTHFIEVLETQIKEIFNQIYRESLQGWEEWYADLIAEDYGLDQFDDFDVIASTIEPEVVKQIERQEELKPTNKAMGTIEQDGKVYDLYVTSRGRIGKRYSLSKN